MSSSTNLPARRRPKSSTKSSNFSLYLIGGVLLLLIIGVIGINIWNSRTIVSFQPIDVESGWIERNALGSPEAKVVIDAYEDFRCPACRQWTETVKPQLFADYIKTGQVRFVYNTFPLQNHGAQAKIAAMASLCAADQTQFWQMHDQLFNIEKSQGQAGFDVDALAKLAGSMGMDSKEFSACMNSLKYEATVNQSIARGVEQQVNATPTLFLNGKKVEDPFDYAALKTAIDSALAGA